MRALRLCLFICAGFGSFPLLAEWRSQLNLSEIYDTNYNLSARDDQELFVTNLSARQEYINRTERGLLDLWADLGWKGYQGDTRELKDSGRGQLAIDTNYQTSERSEIGGSLVLQTDSSQSDEYREFFGLIGLQERSVEKRKVQSDLSVNGSHILSENWLLGWAYDGVLTRYLEAESTRLINYRFERATLTLNHQLGERWSVFGLLDGDWFDPAPSSQLVQRISAVDSNSLSGRLGVIWQMDALTELSMSLGHRRTDYRSEFGENETDSGRSVRVELTKQTELGAGSLLFSESVEPSANGAATLVRRVRASLERQPAERWKTALLFLYENEVQRYRALPAAREELLEAAARATYQLSTKQTATAGLGWRRLLDRNDPNSLKLELRWSVRFD